MRVLGVHGVGNYQSRRTDEAAARRLAVSWSEALRDGVGAGIDLDVRVAYYAPLLRSPIGQSAAGLEFLSSTESDMITRWARVLGVPDAVAQGYITAPLRQIAEWVANKFGLDSRVVEIFVSVFFREVAAYLGDDSAGMRDAVRDFVANCIRTHRPDVLIAHSLGSVVAYEALCANEDLHVDLLLTVGSPLGMPNVVLDRIIPASAVSPVRRRINEWVNIADVGDLVALPPKLRGIYDVDVDRSEQIHLFDFHRVVNYLRCVCVAEAVKNWNKRRFG